jgi:alpha-beta hydrolase superfamily lysophospholipase
MIVSGDADPVGDYAKGIWKTANLYQNAGLKNIVVELFKDGRHEMLNELNKEEVYQSMLGWIALQLSRLSE